MAISFDSALGIHESATLLRARRAEVLANNIANADTPNFKAQDIDFRSILAGEMPKQLEMAQTSESHQSNLINPDHAAEMMFRVPRQPAIDGNTVEVQEEMARYTENALDYQASFDFLSRKFKGLTRALKGE